MLKFAWDPLKAKANQKKHHVAFKEAATVFSDPMSITFYDPNHSAAEDRFITVGFSVNGRLLMVAHTECGDQIVIDHRV
ncbi:MAG: BrnT family toxin [Desulfobacca sp.]|nr:BrnT family toxin [Desulfobacca sp.]